MIESGQLTRWLVLLALSVATAVMFAVSLRSNYLFGYSIGQTDEKRELFAWANVAADIWKAFGLIAVTVLWRAKHRRAALVASLAWLTCLLFGINSALGIYVQDRAALTGSREARHATYEDAQKELAEVEGKLRGRAEHRSIGEIQAAIDAVLGRAVIAGDRVRGTVASVSQTCRKIDARTSEACRQVGELREERAAAVETGKLEARASALRTQVIALREHGGSIAPDPVGELYAWITRGFVSVRDVGFGFPLFFALLIEAVSAFGPVTIVAYAEASRGSASNAVRDSLPKLAAASLDTPWQAQASGGELDDGRVVMWVAERAVPVGANSARSLHELHADYTLWCAASGSRAGSVIHFEAEFDRVRGLPDLAGKIRKFGDRYYGVGLVRRNLPTIGARRARSGLR